MNPITVTSSIVPATLSTRIRSAREFAGLTQEELASRVGISQTAIHKLECGRSRSSRKTVSIALTCGVNPIWLETGTGDMPLGGTRSARYHEASATANFVSERQLTYNTRSTVGYGRIPVISWFEAAHWRETADSFVPDETTTWVPSIKDVSGSAFALRLSDDSMKTEFSENDIIVVDPVVQTENNRFVVALLPGEDKVTFKQLIIDGGRKYLKPLNPRYPIIEIDGRVLICGVVTSKFKEY